ncbi:hypothetical protein RND81_07G010400 [Saponaria officinalis]|uniref:Uncharacterized protein n=1 Tax=Saponaria officinalis TaxID=3572 RepID=A0AAW1JMG4_SAPOF
MDQSGKKKRPAESIKVTCKKAKSTNKKQTKEDKRHQTKEDQAGDKNEEQDTSNAEDPSIGLRKLEKRMSSNEFVTLFTELTSAQLKSLATTPFKYFVNLKVTKFSSKLSHYIVSTYNDRDHEIVLTNKQHFAVRKEDVHNVLGLPMGPTLMTGKPTVSADEYETVFSEWVNQFGKDAKARVVRMGVLKKYIIEHKEQAGPLFKRNIILYIITKMIYCGGNVHVWLDVFPWLVDTDNLNQLDWCEFVIDRLMKLHYVDTVVDGKIDTTRTYPRFKSWTTKELNNREKKNSKRVRKLFEKNVNQEDIKRVITESRKVFSLSCFPNVRHTINSVPKEIHANESVQVKEKAKADNNDNIPSFTQDISINGC